MSSQRVVLLLKKKPFSTKKVMRMLVRRDQNRLNERSHHLYLKNSKNKFFPFFLQTNQGLRYRFLQKNHTTPQATTTTNKVKDRQEGEIEKYKIKVNRIHNSQWITKDKNYRNCCFIGSLFYLGELDGEYEWIR